MNTRNKFDRDFNEAYDALEDVIDGLTKKMPIEMVALVLLRITRYLLVTFTNLAQWEFVKGDLIDIRDDFSSDVEPHLSNLIDRDADAENYEKRYA